MKTARYQLVGGGERVIEYDENAPCVICGEPVLNASMGGTDVCPSCDCGKCRYCGVPLPASASAKDTSEIKRHIVWHKEHPTQ